MTAQERRAAGEVAFCSCSGCARSSPLTLSRWLEPGNWWGDRFSQERCEALLRAIVLQALLNLGGLS